MEALVQEISDKQYILKRKIMLTKKENDGLRYDVHMSTQVINALNRQVDLLVEKERERVGPRKEYVFWVG